MVFTPCDIFDVAGWIVGSIFIPSFVRLGSFLVWCVRYSQLLLGLLCFSLPHMNCLISVGLIDNVFD